MAKFNYYSFYNTKTGEEMGILWKIGKYWLACANHYGTLGGFKSMRHAKQALLRKLHEDGQLKRAEYNYTIEEDR